MRRRAGFTGLPTSLTPGCAIRGRGATYLDRIAAYRIDPPGPDWDGAAVALSKR
jgi:hypothetical protein